MTPRGRNAKHVSRQMAMVLLVASLAACHESGSVDRTGGTADRALERGGESGSAAGRRQTQPLNDSVITTRIKTALFRDPKASGFQISVHAYRGVVQLSGFVDTIDQKQRAGELAGRIEGVRAVHNDLIVTAGSEFTSSGAGHPTASSDSNVVQSSQGGKP